jgi:hypothetical protein
MSAYGTNQTSQSDQLMSAFGGKAHIDEREIDKLIEATKRATSFRGFSFAKSQRKRRGQRIGAIASEPDRGVRDSHVLDVGITFGLR